MLKQHPEKDKRTDRHLRKRGLYLAITLLLIGFIFWWAVRDGNDTEDLAYVDGHLVNVKLLNLPTNRWVRIAPVPLACLCQM